MNRRKLGVVALGLMALTTFGVTLAQQPKKKAANEKPVAGGCSQGTCRGAASVREGVFGLPAGMRHVYHPLCSPARRR